MIGAAVGAFDLFGDAGGLPDAAGLLLDGVRPAMVMDFAADRYALPELGPELFPAGAFAEPERWTRDTARTTSGTIDTTGAEIVTSSYGKVLDCALPITLAAGSVYRVEVTGTALAGQRFHFSSSPTAFVQSPSGAFYLMASGGDTHLVINNQATFPATIKFTGLSIRQVLLDQLRPATFSECFAFSASSTTARTYVDAAGVLRNDLAVDQPRFDWSTGRRRLLLENAATNKVTARKHNPVDTAGISIVGGGSATLDAVSRPDLLAAAGLGALCSNGMVYRLTVTAGQAYAQIGGTTGNTNAHTVGAYIASTVSCEIRGSSASNGASPNYPASSILALRSNVVATPAASSMQIVIGGGVGVYHFILPQLVEAPVLGSIIPGDTLAAVTRAIETARVSPLVEALFQRSEGTLRAQYRLYREATSVQRIVGAAGAVCLVGDGGQVARLSTFNSSGVSLQQTGTKSLVAGTGSLAAWSAAGRALQADGAAAPATDTNTIGDRAQVYLGRGGTVAANPAYGDGWYDSVTLWPMRGANASLPALAVAA